MPITTTSRANGAGTNALQNTNAPSSNLPLSIPTLSVRCMPMAASAIRTNASVRYDRIAANIRF